MASQVKGTGFKSLLPWGLVFILIVIIICTKTSFVFNHHTRINSEQNVKRDFMFKIQNFVTKNQGGQTVDMYFHYRYLDGIKTADIPDYRQPRGTAIAYMNSLDTASNPYWETISKGICEELKSKYPIEAISCQLLVLGDDRSGLPNEPGLHSSITTIGDIAPLTFINPSITSGN